MCILLTTTKHPEYPLIVLSNRDEFFIRPTQAGHLRPSKVGGELLTPLDMARDEHGTWIGVHSSRTGSNGTVYGPRIAVLLNYREQDLTLVPSEVSRGILPLSFLESPHQDDTRWQDDLAAANIDVSKIGGFTLVYGTIRVDPETKAIDHLRLVSNRGHHSTIHGKSSSGHFHKTFGVSNSLFTDPWRKVEQGTAELEKVAEEGLTGDALAQQCFKVLSIDTYSKEVLESGTWSEKLAELRNSVFIPPVDTGYEAAKNQTLGKWYGTRTQIVVLVDRSGVLHYYERNLHDGDTSEVNQDTGVKYYKVE